jgi:hypothetical protein
VKNRSKEVVGNQTHRSSRVIGDMGTSPINRSRKCKHSKGENKGGKSVHQEQIFEVRKEWECQNNESEQKGRLKGKC